MRTDLTMPVEHLSSVPPAASEGSLVRTVGDRAPENAAAGCAPSARVCLLTGGDDRPYALGMASALVAQGIALISLVAISWTRPSCTAPRF